MHTTRFPKKFHKGHAQSQKIGEINN
jgi:hypothetical protein